MCLMCVLMSPPLASTVSLGTGSKRGAHLNGGVRMAWTRNDRPCHDQYSSSPKHARHTLSSTAFQLKRTSDADNGRESRGSFRRSVHAKHACGHRHGGA